MKKYELTDEFKIAPNGKKVFRIKALIDIPKFDVKAGELGGFVESENNLSHVGDCWVSGEAWVYGKAQVSDSAWIYDKAIVTKNPIVITNTKYNITISDNIVCWGCRNFTFDEVKKLELKDCRETWEPNEFELNKKIITEIIRYYRSEHVFMVSES